MLLKGATPLVDNAKNKAPVISLREIAADRVRYDKDLKEIMGTHPDDLRARYGEPYKERREAKGTAPVSGSPHFF